MNMVRLVIRILILKKISLKQILFSINVIVHTLLLINLEERIITISPQQIIQIMMLLHKNIIQLTILVLQEMLQDIKIKETRKKMNTVIVKEIKEMYLIRIDKLILLVDNIKIFLKYPTL